jgi:hypothetical protein
MVSELLVLVLSGRQRKVAIPRSPKEQIKPEFTEGKEKETHREKPSGSPAKKRRRLRPRRSSRSDGHRYAEASVEEPWQWRGTHLATAERENLFGGKVHATQLPASWPWCRTSQSLAKGARGAPAATSSLLRYQRRVLGNGRERKESKRAPPAEGCRPSPAARSGDSASSAGRHARGEKERRGVHHPPPPPRLAPAVAGGAPAAGLVGLPPAAIGRDKTVGNGDGASVALGFPGWLVRLFSPSERRAGPSDPIRRPGAHGERQPAHRRATGRTKLGHREGGRLYLPHSAQGERIAGRGPRMATGRYSFFCYFFYRTQF